MHPAPGEGSQGLRTGGVWKLPSSPSHPTGHPSFSIWVPVCGFNYGDILACGTACSQRPAAPAVRVGSQFLILPPSQPPVQLRSFCDIAELPLGVGARRAPGLCSRPVPPCTWASTCRGFILLGSVLSLAPLFCRGGHSPRLTHLKS